MAFAPECRPSRNSPGHPPRSVIDVHLERHRDEVLRPSYVVSSETALPEPTGFGTLLAEGNSLFKYGDIRKARNAYEKAWKSGSAAGAYNLARSYDPVILASLNLKKTAPDKAKALEWYERAATAGHEEAAAAIVRLRLKR